MEISTGTVTAVSEPHITTDKARLRVMNMATVIDVTVNLGGTQQTIELADSLTYTSSADGSLLFSPNKEDILNGVRMVKAQSEEALRMVEQHKSTIGKCDTLLHDFDPIYRQNVDTEARLNELQRKLDLQNQGMGELKDMLQKLMSRKPTAG